MLVNTNRMRFRAIHNKGNFYITNQICTRPSVLFKFRVRVQFTMICTHISSCTMSSHSDHVMIIKGLQGDSNPIPDRLKMETVKFALPRKKEM